VDRRGVRAAAGRLTLACAALDARPLFWTEPDGSRHGYEPAVAKLVAGELGLELEWRFERWAGMRPALERGDCDAIWCGAAITPERRRTFAFSRPYALFDESVLVRAGDGIHTAQDLRGRRVGAIAASTNMALAETFTGAQTVAFDGTSEDVLAEMLAALRSGDVDAVVDDEPAFLGLRDPALEVAFTCPTGQRWGAALRHGDDELRDALDDALARVDLHAAWERWLPPLPFPPGL
jgi:polar amino acid transport system substrate-binding protein